MKTLTTIFFCIIYNLEISSQIFTELSGGINYGDVFENYTNLSITKFSSATDWKAGIGVGYKCNGRWFIKSGFYGSLRSGKGKYIIGSPFEVKATFSFYEIPVIYYRNFYYPKLYLGIGIVNSIMESPSIHLIDEKTYQTDLTFNIRYEITNPLNFEFSYMIGDVFSLFNKDKQRFLFSTANLSCNLKLFSINLKKEKHKIGLRF